MTLARSSLLAFLALLAFVAGSGDALAQTGQQRYQQWCQGCHGPPANNADGVLGGKDWNIIKLAMDTRELMNEQLRPAYDEGVLTDEDFMAIAAYLATFAGTGTMPPVAQVVEYYNAGFGHYFMTADDDEVAGLDAGAYNFAFMRTGLGFRGFESQATGLVAVCRFFTTPGTFGARSSHFYTANPAECDGLKLNPAWVYEKIAFYSRVPSAGACAAGTLPVYRLYNNGQTGAPNHRFTTDLALFQQLALQNWSQEGIAFCAPP